MKLLGILASFIVVTLTVSGCGGGTTAVSSPSLPAPAPPPTPSVGRVKISSLSPSSAVSGSSDLTLTITGENLDITHTGSHPTITQAVWNHTALNATVVSSTELTTVVPATLLAAPAQVQIFVQKWFFADESPFAVSNSLAFTVTHAAAPSVIPSADILGPNGTRQFVATGFVDNSAISWSIEEGQIGGAISSNGLYSAPSNPGTYHIVAMSSSSSQTATSAVTVTSSGFTATGSMHVARSGHTATLLKDGKVLIVGGGGDTAEVFDPANGTFSLTGPLVSRRSGASATLLSNGRVLVSGGFGLAVGEEGSPVLNTAEIFDPATNTFSPTGSMQQGRWDHVATLLNDGHVLITGGRKGHICFTASAEVFDPATGTFSFAGLMLSERDGHTATLLATGEVLIAGGSNGCAPDSSDDPPWDPLFAELYEPKSRSFQGGGNMSTTRVGHVAIRLANGRVLVLGGIPTVQNLHEQPPNPSYAELYDPVLHTFSPVAGVSISQAGYTTTLLNNGMVLTIGGTNSTGKAIADVQLLDPGPGVLSSSGSLGHARVGHTATLLRDGRVLVTGGTDSNGHGLASAEMYQ